MTIARARLYRQWQPFADGPYVCRGHSADGFDSCIVAIEDSGGRVGWGEAAPLGAFYAEAFPEQIEAGIRRLLPTVVGCGADAPLRVADAMNHAMMGQPAVKSAIDMAAWDLAARRAGVPLAAYLGGADAGPIALYRSIGQDTPDAMAARAADLVAAGYRRLQVKVGQDPLDDARRLAAVRAAVPADVPLYADANGAWTLDAAVRFCDATRDVDYRLEQPCMGFEENRAVARHCTKPMILDEGIATLDDLLRACAADMIAGVTLKIARLGGVGPTRLIRDVAVDRGLMVTIEDTGGSTVDTAATAHLMVSTPANHRAHTVDFMTWVTVANATGMPAPSGGVLPVPDGAGLGIDGDLDALGAAVYEVTP